MKKIVPLLLIFFITTGAGYKGSLPNIEAEFGYKKTIPPVSAPPFTPRENEDFSDLKPIPREKKSYVEIILKKDKSSQYTIDTNEVILLLEKLKKSIEKEQDIQKFNAIVSNLIDHISYIQEEYKDKQESNFISYKSLQPLSEQARATAMLRTESLIYTKYLPYESTGSIYRDKNIQKQLKLLLKSVEQTLYTLKNID